ncbi:hypothetical protein ONS95_002710 [Cadophora gregata]|uniref:uncharacterized protein n=1 Tax=Cadophora gregata TaxID=51156 RepID=UPI0026DD40A7|nr:uncharacterized protein ONS95_002710 [Cadophora gregata]KAK0110050.1 hypothetical protein ONS95_002710 [Cadophora gregata]KAK0110329.1 hypothetical protein ONS96_001945 [Cadophora gregata f. sp. sojae]
MDPYTDYVTGECLQFPDFCPICLENGGDFSELLNDEARDKLTGHPLFSAFHRYEQGRIAKQIWERVESHPAQILSDDSIRVEEATPTSNLTFRITQDIYDLLSYSFWREVINERRSPSPVKRKLLVQLRKYAMSQIVQERSRLYLLEQAHESVRPTLLMTVLRSIGLDDLADADSDCTICMAPLSNPGAVVKLEIPVKTPCGHIFGNKCICTWIRDNTNCPNCRRELLSLKASETVLAAQQESTRSEVAMPMFLYRLLGLDPALAAGDLDIIKERGLRWWLFQRRIKEPAEEPEAMAAGLVTLTLSSGSETPPSPTQHEAT